ncbi:MAG: threonine synthase [Nitrospirota bacterium]|nr:threonine synthase [Nitrospirota bacterium]
MATMWRGLIREYREFLPVTDKTPVVTLQEGNTPLIPTRRLNMAINPDIEIYLKYDGANPTGSFKDRGMTMAVSKAREKGATSIICASTGNTSAAAAAYGASAGMDVFVLIPEGKIALGKLAQAMAYGAKVIQVQGNFDQALRIVSEISASFPITLVNSINPFRLEGQKTAAFEVVDQLGNAPDYHFLPVGNAGNITAYWKGYREYRDKGLSRALPKMMGWQAEGSAPIVLGHVVEKPSTIATAIRIGNPASWKGATDAARESGGRIDMVSDAEILDAYRMIAALEGVFCEPASAASVAGLIKANKANLFQPGDRVVCTLTGHGLKDPDVALKVIDAPKTVDATLNAVLHVLGF